MSDRLHAAGCVPLPSHDRRAHRYLDPARLYYAGLAEHPELREVLRFWIEGQPGEWSRDLNPLLRRQVPGPRLLALPDYRTFGHVYAYLLGGLSCLCREAGYAGLALLGDEAEFYAALTPDPPGLAALDAWVHLDRHLVELARLQPSDYEEFHERVRAIYRAAHPGFELPAGVAGPMGRLLDAALECGWTCGRWTTS